MVPEDQSPPSPASSDLSSNKGPRRRSRRGGRRHSRRRDPSSPDTTPEDASAESELPVSNAVPKTNIEQPSTEETRQPLPPLRPAVVMRAREQNRQVENSEPARNASEPAFREESEKLAGISKAIAQVNEIIAELKHALEEMDDVLETLELAERQKIDDEREIENLQRSLRRLHRPRESEGQKNREP